MWCLEPNLVPYKTSRGDKRARWGYRRPLLTPPGPPKPCPDPPNWSVITPYDVQWPKNFNPPKNGPKTARKWPKMRNRPKMGQKRIFSKSCNGPILKFWELTRTTKIKKMTLSFGMVLFFYLKRLPVPCDRLTKLTISTLASHCQHSFTPTCEEKKSEPELITATLRTSTWDGKTL